MSNDVQVYMAALTSWAAAILAVAWQNQSEIMFVLGFVLVVARLVQELPKAYRQIKEWLNV